MKVRAIIETQHPGIDHVILWDDNDRLIAYAYQHGRVMKTRPLAHPDTTPAVQEAVHAFQLNDAQLTRINERPSRIGPQPSRWN